MSVSKEPPDRALVLGASGFIGGVIADALAGRGVDVVRHSSGTCDLADPGSVRRALASATPRTSIVFCSAIPRTVDDTAASFVRNVSFVANLSEALEAHPVRDIVFLSSVDVYGRPATELPLTEQSPVRPTTLYGVAKLASEELLGMVARRGTPVSVARLPGVFGPGDRGRSVIARLIHAVTNDREIEVAGDGTVLRDYVWAADVGSIVARWVERPDNRLVNVVSGESRSLSAILDLIGDATGVTPRTVHRDDLPTGGDLVFGSGQLQADCPGLRMTPVGEGIHAYLRPGG